MAAGWIYPQLVLGGLAVFYTVQNLQFTTQRVDLVGADKEYHRNFLKFKRDFRVQNDLVAVVESESEEPAVRGTLAHRCNSRRTCSR